MARTNAGAVQSILQKDYDTIDTPSLQGYIETASLVVDDVVDCATAKGVSFSSTRLEVIERWLAAHFYGQSDKPYTNKSTNGASAGFSGQTGMYLESTLYGQTATRLDSTGCLAAIANGERKVASLNWLGKAPSDQLDWDERD